MDKYEPSSALVCDIVTHPAYPPQEWVRLAVRPRIATVLRSIVSEVELSNGEIDQLLLADPMQDLTLDASALTDANIRALRHIIARSVPVVVYSPWAGSCKLMAPLSTSCLSTTGTLTEIGDTEFNLLRADPGRGLYSEQGGFFLNGVQTGLGQSSPFPLGTGMLCHGRVHNLTDGEDWSVSGSAGTPTTETRASWLNEDQTCMVAYTDGGTAILECTSFDTVAGEIYAVTVAYHSDGELDVTIYWPVGGSKTTVATGLTGSGLLCTTVTVPAGQTRGQLQLIQTSGTVSMWAAWGVYYRREGATHRQAYEVRQVAEAVADVHHSAVVEDLFLAPTSWASGLVCVSGYCQPGWGTSSGDYLTGRLNTVVSVADEENDHDLRAGFAYRVATGKTTIMIWFDSSGVGAALAEDHVLGDSYWFCLYFGMTTLGARVASFVVTNLRTGSSTTVTQGTSATTPIYDSLTIGAKWGTIGTASGMIDHFDGLVGGLGICNIAHADLADFIAYHGDARVLETIALTNGRAFSLSMSANPSPWEQGRFSAVLNLRQIGRL